jgi:hypothetical protein
MSVVETQTPPAPTAGEEAQLKQLYADFERHHPIPLWTQTNDLMPFTPQPKAVPHIWRWADLYPLAKRSGDLIPVGRGGDRPAIGLANPGLGGNAYISRHCGPRSNTSARGRQRRSTGIRRTHSAFWSKAKASGPWSTAIRYG